MPDKIKSHLQFLYGDAQAQVVYPRLEKIIAHYQTSLSTHGTDAGGFFSEQDTVLITYGDMVQEAGERPLQTLYDFLAGTIKDSINTVHILPFFPYSSDDGFSVID